MTTQSIIILVLAVFIAMFIYFIPLNIWLTAIFSGVKLDFQEIVFMRIRNSPIQEIVNGMIVSSKLGLNLTREDLETHALASGNVTSVVKTMAKAKEKNIPITFKEVSAWDLAGNNMEERLLSKQNDSDSENLKITILNKVKTLSEEQLKKVNAYITSL